ncbi:MULTISPECIES: ABC transporter permease subunit [unclassified Ensifer]|uniref:amino acid ABC transporter permease n=1 Tax=unclassified Ensifer TaxID=2633371 RepID=UPI000813C8B0|nr:MULTISPECIES: ABC transporter permease subunit [unclassified Ensifer]OCP05922.1 amino acid ABC transporter permease [Ensifer sp. LC11]OCP06676.1 amino acid ABC transporter permease [Ensifer sp. LC13]OCP06934.1 amino acid ABC transporter permease [Ensifer sp. LC14]OCP31459.1 amino acid ABC transporter permease [Ensifer sp. LC499]
MTRHIQPGPSGPGLVSRLRSWIGPLPLQQSLVFIGVLLLFAFLGQNTADSMHRTGLTPGFAFLSHQANFEIGESLLPYSAGDSYARALAAGIANTVKVAIFGCLLATVLGVALGIARLSGNLLLASFVHAYVELLRNTPLLLQLFLWSAIIHALPPPRGAYTFLGSVYLSNRGVYVPSISVDGLSVAIWLPSVVLAIFAALAIARRLLAGSALYLPKVFGAAFGAVVCCLALAAFGLTASVDVPAKGGFNIRGGLSLTPEFAALLIGLVVNASASISEIVRSGIQSVKAGQWEAARALGLKPAQILRLVVLPQALRVITPLMISSFLDLTKNSSLAVAIGYPDLVSVANTTANTTGQALEAIIIIGAVYLTISLAVSAVMNLYNRRVVLRAESTR